MFSHDPFKLLELDRRTATEADVKKAYAAKLKQVRPEDDREGFMALRAAFEQARNAARWRDNNPEHAAEEDAWEDREAAHKQAIAAGAEPPADPDEYEDEADTYAADSYEDNAVEFQIHDAGPSTDPVDMAMEDIRHLASQPFAGASFAPWRDIIERDDLQPIDEYQRMSEHLRGYVCQEAGLYTDEERRKLPTWLTLNVFNGLKDHYGWMNQASNDYWVREQIDWLYKIEYHLNRPAEDIKRDRKLKDKGYTPSSNYPEPRSGGTVTDNTSIGWWRIIWFAIVAVMVLRVCTENSSPSYNSRVDTSRILERIEAGEFQISPSTETALKRINTRRAIQQKQQELTALLIGSMQDDGSYSETDLTKINSLKAEIEDLQNKLDELSSLPPRATPPED